MTTKSPPQFLFGMLKPTVQQDPEDCSSEGADNCPLGESGVAGVDPMLKLSGIHVSPREFVFIDSI